MQTHSQREKKKISRKKTANATATDVLATLSSSPKSKKKTTRRKKKEENIELVIEEPTALHERLPQDMTTITEEFLKETPIVAETVANQKLPQDMTTVTDDLKPLETFIEMELPPPKKSRKLRKKAKTTAVSRKKTSSSSRNSAVESARASKLVSKKIEEKLPTPKTSLKTSPVFQQMETPKRLNEEYSELMVKLAALMMKQKEPMRARAYRNAEQTILKYDGDINSPDQLKGMPGIGPTILEKLRQYTASPEKTLPVLERGKNDPIVILGDVYGIGPKKAEELVKMGITTIAQLRERQEEVLNNVQKVGLKYYEDILKRIPRAEIEEYEAVFEQAFPKEEGAKMEIVGSYRRGAETSGDIDVIITAPDGSTVFKEFVDRLIKKNIILEVLSRGESKCLVIAKLPGNDVARRVDFLYATPEQFPFAILYFTGSKVFNTLMRQRALDQGYSLNEHGMSKMEGKIKGQLVDHVFPDEKSIFDFLGMEYKTPMERQDARAIVAGPTSGAKMVANEKMPPTSIKDTFAVVQTAPTSVKESFAEVLPKTKLVKKNTSLKKAKKTGATAIEFEVAGVEPDSMIDVKKAEEIPAEIMKAITDFKKNGISVLDGLNENQLSQIIHVARYVYYNDMPVMTDNQYDIIKEYVENKYPKNAEVLAVGAPVGKNKVELPYEMASMDKIKPDTGALGAWIKKYAGPYVVSTKLDGVSGLYTTEGEKPKLYTRGNGKVGQDVSHLIPYLRLPKTQGIVIRGEFVIQKGVFEKKYKDKFANARNLVAGIINHKSVDEKARDISFVAYEVIKPELKPSAQMEFLGTLDVEPVYYQVLDTVSNDVLSKLLIDLRKNYAYEIDGIIVTDDKLYPRTSGNPEHSFAFKMILSDQIAEAKVVNVIWTPSKDGYLKPRVQIEPIQLGGVRIEYATGFNGAFIEQNKVGIGALIELIRSGDVIPHIKSVTEPAEEAKMPDFDYKWNDTHVDVMLEDAGSNETVKEKNITGFFKGIEVEGLSSGNVARIIKAGHDSVPAILQMGLSDFLKVDGFKQKMATKLYEGIQEKVGAASLVTIMSASNIFGRGFNDKRLDPILEAEPDILTSIDAPQVKVEKLRKIKGIEKKTAEAFVSKIPAFMSFLQDAHLEQKLSTAASTLEKIAVDEAHPLFKKTVVMTGIRDKAVIEALKTVGAKLGSSVSSNTFVVIAKSKDEDTGKAEEAKQKGIPIMTPDEFMQTYFA